LDKERRLRPLPDQ